VRRAPGMLFAFVITACGSGKTPDPSACESECQDAVAVRGFRETLKLVYNRTLQGQATGPQDASIDCPLGGSARVLGTATSNPEQGASFLDLTVTLSDCAYLQRRSEPTESYSLRTHGVVHESGVLAVQPTATTALSLESDALTIEGTVYDPPLEFRIEACALDLTQNGDNVSGMLCGRAVGVDL
jgi:hypothetical protein